MKRAAILIFGMYREFVEMRNDCKIVEEFYDCDYLDLLNFLRLHLFKVISTRLSLIPFSDW